MSTSDVAVRMLHCDGPNCGAHAEIKVYPGARQEYPPGGWLTLTCIRGEGRDPKKDQMKTWPERDFCPECAAKILPLLGKPHPRQKAIGEGFAG